MAGLDFAVVLVWVTVVAGVLWAIDAWVFKPKRQAEAKMPWWAEYAKSFFPILLIVLVVRSFWFEPFRIPSGSMVPTLLVGDFIVVNKYKYGLRFPIGNVKILNVGEPQRGDVVVFRLPSHTSTYYIKRLVGLPGDTVVYQNDQLTINGERIPIEADGAYQGPGQPGARLSYETLGEQPHAVLHMFKRQSEQGTFEVPQGHYFMMGDNRDNSKDSRYPGVSMVPEALLVGKAQRIWMHFNTRSTPRFRWDRMGDKII